MLKYEFTKESIEIEGRTLHRIRAANSFGDIQKGQLGGFVEKIENLNILAQEGNAWIYNNAKVFGDGLITGNAQVKGNAIVCGNAAVGDHAFITGSAKVFENAIITGNALIGENATISGNSKVFGESIISGNAIVEDYSKIYGKSRVFNNQKITGCTEICDSTVKLLQEGSIVNCSDDKMMYVKNIDIKNKSFEAYRVCTLNQLSQFSTALRLPNDLNNKILLDKKYNLKFSSVQKILGNVDKNFKNKMMETVDFLNSKGLINDSSNNRSSLSNNIHKAVAIEL